MVETGDSSHDSRVEFLQNVGNIPRPYQSFDPSTFVRMSYVVYNFFPVGVKNLPVFTYTASSRSETSKRRILSKSWCLRH